MSSRRAERPTPGAPAAAKPARRTLGALFSRGQKQAGLLERARGRAGDVVIAALGLALGFGCAAFPWYIFFNQDKFGIRAVKFEGNPDQVRSLSMGASGERIGIDLEDGVFLPEQLDLFATGTVSDGDDETPAAMPAPEAQEFPATPPEYRMVYASPGRAMIADDSGMWVVQRGSLLPDNSMVASIEQRGGAWVLVTSDQRVVELSAE